MTSSTERSTGDDENGFFAATFDIGANSFGHVLPIVRDTAPEPAATRVVQQAVLHGGAGQPVLDGVLADVVEDLVATVFHLAVDVLAVVGLVVPLGERPQRRPVLRADDHHHVRRARGDLVAEFGDELLRALSADGFDDRPRGLHTEALHHRPRIVVGLAEQNRHARRDLELPQADDRVDRLGDGVGVRAGVGQRGPDRLGGQFHRGHAAVAGIVDVLGELADTDDHRGARINHYRPPGDC